MFFLREYKSEDAELIVKWLDSESTFFNWSRDEINKYPISVSDIQDFFGKKIDEGGFFAYTVLEDDTIPVGFLSMMHLGGNMCDVRFGHVLLDDSMRGQGLSKKLISAALDFAFEVLLADRISVAVIDTNECAKSLYNSVGMELYDFQENSAIINGSPASLCYYEKNKISDEEDARI